MNTNNYYLGLDLGTTGIKAVVFDREGNACGTGLSEYLLETPFPDIVELDAEQYWISTKEAVKSAIEKSGIEPKNIRSLAITGQAETLIMVDELGNPLRKAIVWLDNRAYEEAAVIEKNFSIDTLFTVSGQTEMLPCWPAAKILWLRNHEFEVFSKTAKYLMVEDYIGFKLTGKYATCRGLMPSSLYYCLSTGKYDQNMLDFLGISENQLPELKDCGAIIGNCVKNSSLISPDTLVIAAPIDHVCGNLGSGCAGKGVISETTGCSLALCASFPKLIYDEERRISTYLGFTPGEFVLLPWAPTAGMLFKYFRDEFTDSMDYNELNKAASQVKPGSCGLILLPHCAGAVSPVSSPKARGVAYGITLAHKREHWARAIMEAVAYLLRDNVEVLKKLGAQITEIRSLGGGAKSDLWLQIKADVLGIPVVVTKCEEATALGAAVLAAAGCGEYADTAEAAGKMVKISRRINPGKNSAVYQEYFKEYQNLNKLLMPTFGGNL